MKWATPNTNKRFFVFFVEHLLWIESSESPSLPTRIETHLGLRGSCVLLAWLVLIDWSTVNPSPCVFSLDVVQVVQDLLLGGKASPRVCPNSWSCNTFDRSNIYASLWLGEGFGTRLWSVLITRESTEGVDWRVGHCSRLSDLGGLSQRDRF